MCKRRHLLVDWEMGFIDCLSLMDDIQNISDKQYESLKKIYQVLILENELNK